MPKKMLYYCKEVGIANCDEIQLALMLSIKARLPEHFQHILDPVIDKIWDT